jgi:hypothetical protein
MYDRCLRDFSQIYLIYIFPTINAFWLIIVSPEVVNFFFKCILFFGVFLLLCFELD